MNLICFPHYTCGGLLCDIFQRTFSEIGKNGGIQSVNHGIGKIDDSDTIFDNYDIANFTSKIDQVDLNNNIWIGTHCWPGILDSIMKFNKILLITTTTNRSKIYRWLRVYHHYYEKSDPWKSVTGIDRVDKERETAKNYLKSFLPVHGENCINIEFSEIVDQTPQFLNLVNAYDIGRHMARWKSNNSFLYNQDIWNCNAVKRFHEAENETNLNQNYIYA